MTAWRPGLRDRRQIALMRAAVARCRLDLRGLTVLTEAASGAYVVTPVLAAMAGARKVFAATRGGPYGSVDEIRRITMDLARAAGVAESIEIVIFPIAMISAMMRLLTSIGPTGGALAPSPRSSTVR